MIILIVLYLITVRMKIIIWEESGLASFEEFTIACFEEGDCSDFKIANCISLMLCA